jgi:hypothetical protein
MPRLLCSGRRFLDGLQTGTLRGLNPKEVKGTTTLSPPDGTQGSILSTGHCRLPNTGLLTSVPPGSDSNTVLHVTVIRRKTIGFTSRQQSQSQAVACVRGLKQIGSLN